MTESCRPAPSQRRLFRSPRRTSSSGMTGIYCSRHHSCLGGSNPDTELRVSSLAPTETKGSHIHCQYFYWDARNFWGQSNQEERRERRQRPSQKRQMIRSIGVAAFALAIAAPASAGSITHRLQSSVQLSVDAAATQASRIGSTYSVQGNNVSLSTAGGLGFSAQGTQLDIPLRTTQLLTPAKASA